MLVLGIRPDVIRSSLVIRQLNERLGSRFVFIWSGQHYSDNLKDIFFRQLEVKRPDYELGIAGVSDADFMGRWISTLGQLLSDLDPEAVAFLGDTNTVVGTLACASLNIPIAHIEGCMRSYDWRMPEEKYRTVADHLSDVIYAYLDEYKQQGLLEGLDPRRIVVTGNPIVDVLQNYFLSGKVRMSQFDRQTFFRSCGLMGASNEEFCIMTAHRRENVETEVSLKNIVNLAGAAKVPVVFPASYRTQKALARMRLSIPQNVHVIDPVGYTELLELMTASSVVLTDSGTVVEETAVLQIPSIQMRTSTERPQVYDSGSSIKFDPHQNYSPSELDNYISSARSRQGVHWVHGLGDGFASQRIVDDLISRLQEPSRFRGHDPQGTNRPISRNAGMGLTNLGLWSSQF